MGRVSDTEKITINVGPVDLGRIDLLVEQGLYSNRTDLIRTAIRNQLERHESLIQDAVVRRRYSLGVIAVGEEELEKQLAKGEKVAYRVVGMLTIDRHVPPQLALDTIDSIVVRGVFRSSKVVRDALGDRVVDSTRV